jgi:predicted transposase YbfD/YdcC
MPTCTPITERFESLSDLRSALHITYPLPEVLFVVYASILSGYKEWKSMADFASYNLPWFRQFFPYQWGTPSLYIIEKVCMLVDPKAFMQIFVDWMGDVVAQINDQKDDTEANLETNIHDVIPIDGKALKGSRPAKGKKMVHIVSAYSTKLNLILGFTPVDKKSNEITAIPELLDMLVIEGCLITSDAMGCQKEVCKKIVDKKADYLICTKGNQPTLCDNIEKVFIKHMTDNARDPEPSDTEACFAETKERSRNRQEHRRCWVFNDVLTIDPDREWPKLTQFAVIQRDRLIGSKQTTELHCYIMSRAMPAKSVLESVRSHWRTENCQHWKLDVSFNEDASKIHERTAVKNVATFRRACLNVHNLSDRFPKESMKSRIVLAGLDDEYRTELVREHSFF